MHGNTTGKHPRALQGKLAHKPTAAQHSDTKRLQNPLVLIRSEGFKRSKTHWLAVTWMWQTRRLLYRI
jgi:hypothetical protein